MLLQAFSSHNSVERINIRRNTNTLTRNLLTGALILLFLTAGMMLTTPQDAHAQSIGVTLTEPAGTQTSKTFKVQVTLTHAASAGPGGNGEFTVEDVTVATTRTEGSGDATVVAVLGSNKLYDVTIRPPGNAIGSVTLTIKKDSITAFHSTLDWIYGPSSAETTNSISFDTTNLLMVDFTEPEGTQTGSTFTVPIDFSHTVTNFDATDDIDVATTRTSGTGDATVALSGSGSSYTATVTPPSNAAGSVTLTIKANMVGFKQNLNGPSSDETSNSISFDTVPITVGFTEPESSQSGTTFDVPITFNKSVTGFASSDITVTTTRTSGTGDATVALSGSGTSWTATVTSPTAAKGTITLEVAANAVTDSNSVTGPASKATSDAISFDTTVATVDFTEPTGTQVTNTFDVPITFSKSVTGFAAADITIKTTRTSGTGNATFTLNGSGTSWTATVTSPTAAKGTITLEVAADSVTDGTRTGPASKATSDAMSFDTTVPKVDFTEPTSTQVTTFDLPITFSKSVTGFAAADINLNTTRTSGTGDATFTLSGSGKDYKATITVPTNAKGTIRLEVAGGSVTDGTRTGPSQKTDSDAISFDTTPPTVDFTEPTDVQAKNFSVEITFSKSVTGFTSDDITINTTRTSGSGDATFTLSGSGKVYTATITVPTNAKGTVTLAVAKGAVTDGTRTGPSQKTDSDAISFDTTPPTVSFTEPEGSQYGNTFTVPITISKSVAEFTASDITVTTTRTSGTGDATVALSGSGSSYTATVTSPTAAKGTITLAVAADSVTDGTRTGPASKATSSAISFDTTVATVDFTEPTVGQATNFDLPITFSKSVTGFAAADITITTTRTSGTGDATFTLSGSGKDYTAAITVPTNAKGTVTLAVAADSVTDGTRTGPASKTTSDAISFDTAPPSVTFGEPVGIQYEDTFSVPIAFGKSVTGFAASDITITTTLTSGTGNATFTLLGSGAGYSVNVTPSTETKGTITLQVAKDAVADSQNRSGPVSATTSESISFDNTTPSATYTVPQGVQVTNFDVPIKFSKFILDFELNDLTLTTTHTSGTGDATFRIPGVGGIVGSSGTNFTAKITLPANAAGTVNLSMQADAVEDTGEHEGPSSATETGTISFDTRVPTVSFTEPEGTQVAATFDLPITFNKSVTGFSTVPDPKEAGPDLTVATTRTSGTGNATVTLSGSGTSWTATISLPSAAKGTVRLEISAHSVSDGTRSGPASKATSDAISFDTTVATVDFTEPEGTQVADTFDVPITISKSVTGFAASDITVTTTRTSGSGDATVSLSGSGTSYTATVTSPTAAKGTITLEVAKNAVTDGTRTGPASKATSDAISFDTTVATVSFTEPEGTQVANTFDVPITISKSATGFVASDITVTTTRTSGSGDATVTLSGSGTSYTATVTSPTTAKGTITLEVAKNAVTDGTRTGPASKATSDAISFDTTVATVDFTEPAGTQYGATFDVPITISKSVTGFVASDITVTTTRTSGSGDATVTLSGSGTSYTATVTSPTTAKGTITLEVAKNAVTDGTRTGPASKVTSDAISFDTTVATVTFTEPAGTQVANTFDVPITFNKSVTGFAASDITVTSSTGTASVSLSGSGKDYTATVTSPTAAKGTITLAVAKDAVTDGTRTGPASKATSDAISFDTTVATVDFTEPAGIQVANTFDVPITISKSVTGFAASDITVTSSTGTASVSLSGSGKDYTATVTSPTAAKGTITLEVAKNAVTDGTRTGPASKATSDAISFDTTVATVDFTEPVGTQYRDTFNVGITISKSVTGFAASDITVTSSSGNASVSLSGSGTSYTATVTSPTATKGTITLEVAADSVTDGTRTGPASKATSDAISFDTTVATVSFDEPVGTQLGSGFAVPITFSKNITGFDASDITVTSSTGTASVTLVISGLSLDYSASVISPTNAKGIIILYVAANAVTDGTRTAPANIAVSNPIPFDTTQGTVNFSEPKGVQIAKTFDVGITFSKDVQGFEAGDITIATTHTSGSGNATFTLSGSGKSYTATVTSPTTAEGTVTLAVGKHAAYDRANEVPATTETSQPIAYDTTVATVSFTEPPGTQVADTFDVPITFSKSVTGFEASDITVNTTHTNGSGDATVTLSGSGTSYTATVTSPTEAKGAVTLEISGDSVTDGARSAPESNVSSAAITFDTTTPTVSFTVPPNVQTGPFDVDITFSRSVTGFEVGDMTLTTTRTSGTGDATFTLTGSGTDYTATLTPPADAIGRVVFTVKADAASDGVRNGPAENASVSVSFDTQVSKPPLNTDPINTPPVLSDPINTPPVNTTPATLVFSEPSGTQRANTFNVGITFSKSVTGFAASDITVASTSGTASVSLSGSGTSWTATITSPTDAAGSATLSIAANAANDGTHDVPTTAQMSASIAFDTTLPTVSFTVPQGVQASAFDVGITFSKSVTGFEVGDMTLTTTRTSGTGDATFTLTGSGTDYTATLTPPANAAGDIALTVKADAATDGVRNGPVADTSVSVNFDTSVNTPPANTNPVNTPPANTNPVNTPPANTNPVNTPPANTNPVNTPPANTNPVNTPPANTNPVNTPPVNTNPTTLVFSEPSGTQLNNTFDVGITFSKPVTEFETDDITLITTRADTSGGTVSSVLTGEGANYTTTITVPANAKGTLQVQVRADAANDGVYDVPTAVRTSESIAFDTTVPTVRFTVPQDVQTGPFDVDITFSKPVNGFELGDMTLTTTRMYGIDDATFTLTGSGTDYTVTITPPVDTAGEIVLTVKVNAGTDGVRNGPAADVSITIDFETESQLVDTGSTEEYGSDFGKVIFNEIYNGTEDKNDWIELKNVGQRSVNLGDWEIGIVTGNGKTLEEKKIITLPSYELLPNHILLILNSATEKTAIAAGIDIYTGRWDDAVLESWNVSRYLVTKKLKLPLPVEEKYLLTLREKKDRIGTSEAIVDVASTYWPNNLDHETLMWPLYIQKPTGIRPVFALDAAWRRTDKKIPGTTATKKLPGYLAAAWTASGYQEGRGYDKDAPKTTSLGTPGHLNDYPKGKNLPSGPVSISELMFATRDFGRAAPQWIEFYNTSNKTVDLRGWQFNLEVKPEPNTLRNTTWGFTFEGVHVGPKQTLLIVTQKSSNSGHFPEHKVYDLSVQHTDMPGISELFNVNRYLLLSSAGFSLMLSDANGKMVDKIGNLDGDAKTMDKPAWQLPAGKTLEGYRNSLIRKYENGAPLPGTELSSWKIAKDLKLSFRTYWGHSTDIGNPGYRQGGYLPVSLSHFDALFTGTEVVLKWTTESELDNAGFNIYRSESRTGAFKQINAELIQGAGTTGERQQYEWKDTTAKPNVSYYYRIEDVSFSGVREQLQTVRMRGHVSASGKQFRTWASVKSNR